MSDKLDLLNACQREIDIQKGEKLMGMFEIPYPFKNIHESYESPHYKYPKCMYNPDEKLVDSGFWNEQSKFWWEGAD